MMGRGEDDLSVDSVNKNGITVVLVNYGVYAGRAEDKDRLKSILDQIFKKARARNWNRIAFQVSQSSLVSYPKPLFCDTIVSKTKEYLLKFHEQDDDYRLTMILQVFDHSSCRLVSKYILKNFLESEELLEEEDIEDLQLDNEKQERILRVDSDSSSVFYIDRDFAIEEEEFKQEQIEKARRHRSTVYDIGRISGLQNVRNSTKINLENAIQEGDESEL